MRAGPRRSLLAEVSMRPVLVVDDEPHIRAVLRGYLQADGFEVT